MQIANLRPTTLSNRNGTPPFEWILEYTTASTNQKLEPVTIDMIANPTVDTILESRFKQF